MIIPPPNYTPKRHLRTMDDVQQELQSIAVAFSGKMTFRGYFTAAGEREMSPSPVVGDQWIVERVEETDPGPPAVYEMHHFMRLQTAIRPNRLLSEWQVTVTNA